MDQQEYSKVRDIEVIKQKMEINRIHSKNRE